MNLSIEDIKLLNNQSDRTLAIWYCELNCWRWPRAIPEPESEEVRRNVLQSETRGWTFMEKIKELIGERHIQAMWLQIQNIGSEDKHYDSIFKN